MRVMRMATIMPSCVSYIAVYGERRSDRRAR
jgi:hypothetical protein